MNPAKLLKFQLSKRSWVLLGLYSLAAIVMGIICFFPLISELAYRQAHVYSQEGQIQNFRYHHRYTFAFEKFSKAMRFFPFETHYAMEYIKELERLGMHVSDKEQKRIIFKQANRVIDFIQVIDPINPWYHSKKSSILFQLFLLNKDKQLFHESIARNRLAAYIDYENPIFLLNYANILHRNKRYSEAFYYYKKSLDIDSRFPEAHFNIAHIYMVLNKPKKALDHYLQTKSLRPQFRQIDLMLIQAFLSSKQFTQGDAFIKSLTFRDSKTLEGACYFYFSQNRYQQCLSLLPSYLSLVQDNKSAISVTFVDMIITAYRQLNRVDDARQFLDAQLALDPPNAGLNDLSNKHR